MNIGDLVRIRKTAIDHLSTLWFIELADNKTPLLLVGQINDSHWECLKPDGSNCFLNESYLTKRMW